MYVVDDSWVFEYRQLKRKVDGLSGEGVVNALGGIVIVPPNTDLPPRRLSEDRPAFLTGTITGSSGNAYSGTGATYTAIIEQYGTVTATNGCEPCSGSPGRLGVNVSSVDGTVNGTACVIQNVGSLTVTCFWRDPANSGQFRFCVPNSSQ